MEARQALSPPHTPPPPVLECLRFTCNPSAEPCSADNLMEAFGVLIALALIGAAIVLPIWAVAAILNLRRQAQSDRQESTRYWQDLTARLHVIETKVEELKHEGAAPRAPVPEVHEPVPVAPATIPAAPVPAPPRRVPPPVSIPLPVPPVLTKPDIPRPELSPTPPDVKPPVLPPRPVAPSQHAQTPPTPPPAYVRPAAEPAPRSGLDLEEMLGTNWLNKIGIGILVLGLAFFLAYQLQNLGPAGKVLLGVGLSAAMIAVGVRYETNERYRILARASAAGGWALLYFVSYAVYHVPAAQVVFSRELDFFLMLAVAAAIVGYSLRYKSQATTALAFVLSYLTVGIHHTSFYSLAASVILAVTIVALAFRMQWFALEVFGIVATYFNHFLWVSPVIEGMGANRVEFPEFRLSVLLLAFYWLLFRLSYIYRQVDDDNQERQSTAAALLNGFCFLGLLRYQSVHPEWAFWALLTLGAAELALAALAARRRRIAFVVLATLGSALLVAAVPFRYSGSDLSVLWLVAAETFLLAGVFTREIVFRRIGMLTLAIVSAQMIFGTGAPLLELRLSSSPDVTPDYTTAVLFAVGAFLCYLNSHWVRTRWPNLFRQEFDSTIMSSLTYVGGLLALLAAWFAFPGMSTAVVWATLALLLGVAGKEFVQPALAVQGNLIAVAAIVRLITLNLFSAEQWHGVSLRLITVGITALLLYAAAPFARAADEGKDGPWSVFTAAYTWAASILLGLLVWNEVAPLNVALVWMLLGLVLLEIGLSLNAGFLRVQGYTALVASFLQMLVVNLDAAVAPGQISPRISRVLPLAIAYYYTDWRLRRAASGLDVKKEKLQQAGTVFTYLGTITLAALLDFELQPPWVAAGWAALALIAIAAAYGVKRRDYLHQSFLLAAAVAVRTIAYNFFQLNIVGTSFLQSNRVYAGTAIVLLCAALPFAFALRRSSSRDADTFPQDIPPEQVFFFVPFVLLTMLVALDSTRGQLTVNWGIEGVVVFLFAVWVGERSFRLSGLGLLLMCAAKIFLIDVWGLDPQSKYITLIALGAALVLVSYLYTRYKEKFRQYL